MTLHLILTRHAKSSWDNPKLPDHERPLNKRGRLCATTLGEWLATRGYVPDQILCSSANRTRETCDLISKAMPDQIEADLVKELYSASAEQMLEILKGATGGTVLLIGHNPGCAALATMLAISPPQHERFALYPSAATTVYDFDIEQWADITPGSGIVRDFVVPHDLGID
jgi:phosphohistidine phosphatase